MEVERRGEPGCKPRTTAGGKVVPTSARHAAHSHPRRERAGGQRELARVASHPVPRGWRGQAGRSWLPFSVLLGETPGPAASARCRHPLPHARRRLLPRGSWAHYPFPRRGKVRDQERDFSQLPWGLEPWSGSLRCALAALPGPVPAPRSASGPLPVLGGSAGRAHLEGPHGSRGKEWMLPLKWAVRKSKS